MMMLSTYAPSSTMLLTAFCILAIPAYYLISHIRTQRRIRGFQFMKLPPEIRLQIYEHLIDSSLPKPPPKEKAKAPTRPQPIQSTAQAKPKSKLASFLYPPTPHIIKPLTLINHQIRHEFLQIFCQRSLFSFTLDASQTASHDSFWRLPPPRILSNLQSVHLNMMASPDLVGGFDPRFISGNWALRDEVFARIAQMERLRNLHLSIKACGNQLWNPIWLWHYTSQSFKSSDVMAFRRMTFEFENWNMREPNHLQRNAEGKWEWRCSEEHLVLRDTDGQQPVREFCGALYAECRVCDPARVEGEDW